MRDFELNPSELKLLEIIWLNEPVKPSVLTSICEEKIGWKKSTVFTVLKNIRESGHVSSGRGMIISLISEKDYYHRLADGFVKKYFHSSFPEFVAAYSDGGHMSRDMILECYEAVKNYREGD